MPLLGICLAGRVCWVACILLLRLLSVDITELKRGCDFAVVCFCAVVVGTESGTHGNLTLGLGDLGMLGEDCVVLQTEANNGLKY